MQNTGQGSEKKSYAVILLLVVGLAAFSSAMKELNQVQELSAQTAAFVAQMKDAFAPADDPTTVRVETCQNHQLMLPATPPVPALPPLPAAEIQVAVPNVVVREVTTAPTAPATPTSLPARPATPEVREVPKPTRVVRPAQNPAEVRVVFKNRRYILVTPDVRDTIFKALSHSIDVRSAS